MALELNYDQLQQHMETNFYQGLAFAKQQNYQKAIGYFQKALGTCEILKDCQMKAEILYNLGYAYQLRNSAEDLYLAEDCYQELLNLGNEEYHDKVLLNRANSLVKRGEYERAINVYQELSQVDDTLYVEGWLNQSFAYFCLGKFTDAQYFQDALKCCQKTIELVDSRTNPTVLCYAYHNLGHIYVELKEFSKGMLAFQDSLEFCQKSPKRYETFVDMSIILIYLSQFDLARAYINQAQKYFEQTKDVLGLAGCLFAKGKLNRHRRKIEEATNYFELALSGYREKDYYYGIVKTFFELFQLFKRIDHEKAELYNEQYKFYLNYISPMEEKHVDDNDKEDPHWM